jgi:hypothetical protein
VTIYCPSCGKPNTDQADKCASCGKELTKPKPAAPKFKGTMMMGAPGLKPPPGAPAPAASPPAASPPAASPGPAAPSAAQGFDAATPPAGTPAMPGAGGAAGVGAPPAKKNLAFQATMLGPMSAPIPPPGGGAPGQPRLPGPPPPAAGPPGGSPSTPAAPEPSASPATPAPSGGFSAPAAEPAAPASSGWGGPASASPAASSTPAASGWGGAPASAPPAEGGWGGAPAAPGSPGGLAGNKKLLIGVAAGCLALVVLGCIATAVGFFVLRSKTEQAATSFAAQASRVSLGFTLSGLQMSCASAGPQGAAGFFHPEALAELGDQVCKIDERAIDVFGDASKSTARVLQGTPLAAKATSLGLDADACFLYEAGDAQIAGCILDDGFKIIHMENVASL